MSEDVETASFTDMRLSATSLDALARMGIDTPTPIQAAALPPLLDGYDLIGQARTGSGKTLAFGLPAIEFVDTRTRGVQVLVLTPTRELATQVGGVLDEVGRGKGVKVGLIFGGRPIGPQREMLRKGVHVVVGTPGRVLDLLNQGVLWLDKVRLLVLDEADEMLDQGFGPDVERILARATPARQTVLFSATVPDWVRKTADKHLNDPVSVAVDPNPEDAAPIPHAAYDIPNGDKLSALKDLLDNRGQGSIIVFGRTKHGVKKLAKQLGAVGYPVAALQGNLSQNARDKVMEDFRSGETPVLLATNVAARGLDVTHIEAVINVELPESPELLTHRIGRTGRMGRQGQAITLLGPEDGPKWRQLQRGLVRQIPRLPWRGAQAALDADPEELAAMVVVEPAPRANGRRPAQPGRPAPVQEPRRTAPRAAAAPATNGATHDRGPAPRRAEAQNGAPIREARPARARQGQPQPQLQPRNPNLRERPIQAAPVDPAAFEDPIGDTLVENPKALLSRYGRDPRRPSWTNGDGAGDGGERDRGVGRASNGRGDRGGERGPAPSRESDGLRHQIVCADCGETSEVPFRPDPSRPVYCSDCFRSRPRGGRRPAAAMARA